jgi:hypothetical protein
MKKIQRSKEIETILVLVLACGVLYWQYKKPFFLLLAFVMGVAGLQIPVAAKGIHWVWMKLAEGLGFVMNKVILAIIYIVIVIPLGWIAGKMGRSSVKLKQGGSSYFKDRDHVFSKEDMENPW